MFEKYPTNKTKDGFEIEPLLKLQLQKTLAQERVDKAEQEKKSQRFRQDVDKLRAQAQEAKVRKIDRKSLHLRTRNNADVHLGKLSDQEEMLKANIGGIIGQKKVAVFAKPHFNKIGKGANLTENFDFISAHRFATQDNLVGSKNEDAEFELDGIVLGHGPVTSILSSVDNDQGKADVILSPPALESRDPKTRKQSDGRSSPVQDYVVTEEDTFNYPYTRFLESAAGLEKQASRERLGVGRLTRVPLTRKSEDSAAIDHTDSGTVSNRNSQSKFLQLSRMKPANSKRCVTPSEFASRAMIGYRPDRTAEIAQRRHGGIKRTSVVVPGQMLDRASEKIARNTEMVRARSMLRNPVPRTTKMSSFALIDLGDGNNAPHMTELAQRVVAQKASDDPHRSKQLARPQTQQQMMHQRAPHTRRVSSILGFGSAVTPATMQYETLTQSTGPAPLTGSQGASSGVKGRTIHV